MNFGSSVPPSQTYHFLIRGMVRHFPHVIKAKLMIPDEKKFGKTQDKTIPNWHLKVDPTDEQCYFQNESTRNCLNEFW